MFDVLRRILTLSAVCFAMCAKEMAVEVEKIPLDNVIGAKVIVSSLSGHPNNVWKFTPNLHRRPRCALQPRTFFFGRRSNRQMWLSDLRGYYRAVQQTNQSNSKWDQFRLHYPAAKDSVIVRCVFPRLPFRIALTVSPTGNGNFLCMFVCLWVPQLPMQSTEFAYLWKKAWDSFVYWWFHIYDESET